MDLLKKAASVYDKMLDTEYLFVSGKNGQLHSHILKFTSDEFKHAVGLHKLTDIPAICRSSSSNLLFLIKSGQLTINDISRSTHYSQIESRIKNLAHLEEYLDNAMLYYDWDSKRSPFSNIEASIMIPSQSLIDIGQSTYIFFKNIDNETLKLSECIVETAKSQKLVSLISDKRDYTRGQLRPPTLLYKEKRVLSSGLKTILLDKLSSKQSQQNELNNSSKPMQMSISESQNIPSNLAVRSDGTITLSPTIPPNDLFTQFAEKLIESINKAVNKLKSILSPKLSKSPQYKTTKIPNPPQKNEPVQTSQLTESNKPKAYISRDTLKKNARELAEKRRKKPALTAPSKKHDNSLK